MQTKLNVFAKNITSQHGEDGILEYITDRLGNALIPVACEFGAWDGIFASNIYSLWRHKGWKAILIEGDSDKYQELCKNVAGANAVAIQRYLTMKGADSIDDIFRQQGLAPAIGILSIDIDSYDYHLWKYMSYVDPQVVVIEFNQHIAPHIDYYDPEGHVYLKCSARALERLGRSKGYKLICCTVTNAIFVKQELFNAQHFPDMPVEWLFDYGALKPQVIFTGEGGNMYPVFSKPARSEMKAWWRFYYWLSALPKRKRRFRSPPAAVIQQIRAMGLDV